MNKISLILLLFALPTGIFAQSVEPCGTEEYANSVLSILKEFCLTIGGTVVVGNVQHYTSQYCANVGCADKCKGQYRSQIVTNCCKLERVPRPLSDFTCRQEQSAGIGFTTVSLLAKISVTGPELCTDEFQSCNSDDNGEEEEDDSSSSSSDFDDDDDDDDFDQCFSSYGEAMTANLLRRAECTGDVSGLNVVPHPDDDLWCFIGACNTSSSSSSSDAGDICRATAGELTDIMANLIEDCIIGKPENNHNYNIEYLKNNPPDKLFCITGMCNFSESSSSGGECAGIGSSCTSSSSSSLFSSSSMITKAPCTHKTCSECDDTRGDILDLRPMYNCIDLSYDCDKIFYVTSVSFGTFNASTGAPGCFRFTGKSSLEEIKVACQSSCNFIANSSSSTVSSSSRIESSSSESLFSSSSSVFTSSSSIVLASSSSVAFVSSSSFNTDLDFVCQVCKPFIAGPNASYNHEEVFISGLNNMEPGKCYGLNPDRGTQYGWINDNAQDRWWWEERPCDGSKLIEPVTPSGCRNYKPNTNAVYTTNDCFSAGLNNMEPGKCYGLNPDRGTQYGWINNDAQDRWWWREVPCGMIFLQKKYISESNSDYIQQEETKLLYDAAGRKTTDKPKIRRFLFSPKKTP